MTTSTSQAANATTAKQLMSDTERSAPTDSTER